MNAILSGKLANIQSMTRVESAMVQRFQAENGSGATVTEAQITAIQESIDKKVSEYEAVLSAAPVQGASAPAEAVPGAPAAV